MKQVIIISISIIFLFVPLNVNAISVGEFEKLLQGVQTQDDVDLLLSHLFKNTDYLKTCKDLLEAVAEIDAKMLFPVHTEHPDAYNKISKNITIVEEGVKYELI
ncbi:hypothetical protein AAA799N04_01169 [Marine Group I thaumarchaeote SCGC AAA799-N04]|uniref:Uncharacterized protein n=1 Tax=Marine Group I thaumarchaeote SCGC AAA799-N04 TaxID=1502293 RepID=A0A081RMH4_9ARCH|nr:hypothetical protein AAA799N04_01169 [Marine Group I thaumarchaeote SCGC AAA799-N04]